MLNKVDSQLKESADLLESQTIPVETVAPSLKNAAPLWSPKKRSSTIEVTPLFSDCRSLPELFQQFAATVNLLRHIDSTELGCFRELASNGKSARTAISPYTQSFCDRYRLRHPITKNSDGSTTYVVPQLGITTRELPGHNSSLVKHFGCLVKIRVAQGATHFDQCTFERGPRQFITASQFKQAVTEEMQGSPSLSDPLPHLTLYTHGSALSAGAADIDSAKLALASGAPVVNIDFKSYPFQDKVMALALDQAIAFIGAAKVNLVGSGDGCKFNTDYLAYRYRTNAPLLRMHILAHLQLPISELQKYADHHYNEIIEGSNKTTILISQVGEKSAAHQAEAVEITPNTLLNFSNIAMLLHNEKINATESEQAHWYFPGESLNDPLTTSLTA
jgi:hypothetical protein